MKTRHCCGRFCSVLIAVGLVFNAVSCYAQLTLSLSSDPVDLSALTPGHMFMVDVEVSGLQPGDDLEFLATTVTFDDSLLGTPTSISPGAIIPDISGFTTAALPGSADAVFDAIFASSGDPITTNGIFFSFDVTAAAIGTGGIGISFVDAQLTADLPDETPVVLGPDLNYEIVPEPASITITLSLMASLALFRRKLF